MSDVEQLKGNIERWKGEIAHQQSYIRKAMSRKKACLSGPIDARDPIAALEWQKGINSARGIIRDRQASIKEARRVLAMFESLPGEL